MELSALCFLVSALVPSCDRKALPFARMETAQGYRRHRVTLLGAAPKRRDGSVTAQSGPREKHPKQTDKEVAETLMKERQERMERYLSPMKAANVKGIDQQELVETFGEAFTPENIRKRQERNDRKMYDMPPDVPPTKMLPYFVNLQNPKNPLGDISKELDRGICHDGDISPVDVSTKEGAQDEAHIARGGSTATGQNASAERSELTKEDGSSNATKFALFQDENDRLFEEDSEVEYVGDPLTPYFEAAGRESDTEDETEEDNEDVKEAWYRSRPVSKLAPTDMADGWSILPCGRIYKHVLRSTPLFPEMQRTPKNDAYVSFGFKVADAFTGEVLLSCEEMDYTGMITQLGELNTGLQKMLVSMVTGEQAEFVCHAMELDMANLKEEGLEDLQWVRVWINLITLHYTGEKWWHMSPIEASRYPGPQPDDGKLTKMERLNLKTEELTKQIETELANNPCSPLWDDVMQKLNMQQKASVVEHFDRKLEMQKRQRCSEYSGSRGFGEAIKETGQVKGYDVGRTSGGCGAFYTWYETPFIMYIAIPVAPGVRAEHVKFTLSANHLTLCVANKVIIDDQIKGHVDTDVATSWAMSEKAMEYEPLPAGDPELKEPVLTVSRDDEYHKIIKDPCIIISLRKQGKAMGNWGTPFVNI